MSIPAAGSVIFMSRPVTDGGTAFTGLVTGVLVPSGERVVATYSGADTADGTVTAVGQHTPVPPSNAGIVLSGRCERSSRRVAPACDPPSVAARATS